MKPSVNQIIRLLNDRDNLVSNFSDRFYIAQCDFGRGLFAKRVIKKGEEIFKFTGEIINFQQTLNRENDFGDPLQIGKDLYLNLKEPMRFINHSCNPNTGIKNDVFLIALEKIQKGEEIYFDYSTSMDEDYWIMHCECGNKNCRKIIKDFRHLPPQIKQKYLDLKIVQKFIAVQYQQSHSVLANSYEDQNSVY
jgi:hypothetical protein